MIIEITEKRTSHCWVVCMDAWEVKFKSQGEAQAFVGQLKARIEAPHVWPSGAAPSVVKRPMPERHAFYPKGEQTCTDRVQ